MSYTEDILIEHPAINLFKEINGRIQNFFNEIHCEVRLTIE